MAKNIERIADLLGAKIVCEVPETGGGAFGAYRLAEIVSRLRDRDKPFPVDVSRPTSVEWVHHHSLPLSDSAFKRLQKLAEEASTSEHKIAPMELAAQLLEDAIARCRAE